VSDGTPRNDVSAQIDDLERRATEARRRGEYSHAATLFGTAGALSEDLQRRLHLTMRAAHCHATMGDRQAAEEIARVVVEEAREEFLHAELADALGVLVDAQMINGNLAEATRLLAEVMYVMELVPDVPENYQVMHNCGDTYRDCHFPIPALELYERALALASTDAHRAFTHANAAAAHHMVMNFAASAWLARQHAQQGVVAATAALKVDAQIVARITALAHRAAFFNEIGRHEEALQDAMEARHLADLHGVVAEEAIAMVGEAVARWKLYDDPAALDLIAEAVTKGRGRGALPYLKQATPVSVEVLLSQGRVAEARTVMETQHRMLLTVLHSERDARWEHVRLGVNYRTTAALSESDPLTGLPNRRYLGHWLPAVLDEHAIVCVAVLDLDRFKQINDLFSYAHGDKVLQELAGILHRACRRGDAVARLGGDEFVLVLREASPGDARTILERVRKEISVNVWEGLPPNRRITASVGVSVGHGSSDAARVLATANDALKGAKRSGRDRIVFR
jgi:diguanylate cyclase (GGDEF)-like protein